MGGFEPQKFFIGLVDFFSILLPGGLLAYLGKDWAAGQLLGQSIYELKSPESWLVFFFASYLLGHFAFLLGALLDDWIYDPLRRCTDWGQVRRLANGKGMIATLWRWLATSNLVFGRNADAAVMVVQRLKARALQALEGEGAINAFQWCKARLSKDHPEGLAAVQRFEADSKFFRSFVVVLLALVISYGHVGNWKASLVSAAFLIPALWRYVDQRFKATQQAYWFMLTLDAPLMAGPLVPEPVIRPDGLTHAGGVVFQRLGTTVTYLLVQATTDRGQWVLPKGHIEAGEDLRQSAVREVREETGYWARVIRWIDDVPFGKNAQPPVVRFYLMERIDGAKDRGETAEGTGDAEKWPPEDRQRKWLTLDEAKKHARFDETRRLLEKAEDLREQFAKVDGINNVAENS